MNIQTVQCLFVWLAFFVFLGLGNVQAQESQQELADKVYTWVNQQREGNSLSTLEVDSRLQTVARAHSQAMHKQNLVAATGPTFDSPEDRIKASGLTEVDTLVVVAKGASWEELVTQLGQEENLQVLLSPAMTHIGVGVTEDGENYWLTVQLVERRITFGTFTFTQTSSIPIRRSLEITGSSDQQKIKVVVIAPGASSTQVASEHVLTPDATGAFDEVLSLGSATGDFQFQFSCLRGDSYTLKHAFTLEVH
nr:CAP domain-containing protein [uncultured Desulfobulbus sp.]